MLAKLPKADRQAVLDLSIDAYVRPGSGRLEVWYRAAADFLERAGARPPEQRRDGLSQF